MGKTSEEFGSVEAADGRAGITAELVRRLVAREFPQWAGLPVVPVPADGWDNRTYRLGTSLTVRLPSHERYVAAVAKEDRWLPALAPRLPLPVPVPVALGHPAEGYPHPWSVRRWIEGQPAERALVRDATEFARDLAAFLRALWAIPPADGPIAGAHSFYRGCPPRHYDHEVRRALDELGAVVDRSAAEDVWRQALASSWTAPPVWFHGDIAAGNLLLDPQGRLAAVIDFGTSGVGDPACDLVIAWTFLTGEARTTFRDAVDLDESTWARARGWALWKALIVLAAGTGRDGQDDANLRVVAEVLADHRTAG